MLMAVFMLAAACSKDKRIERRLQSREGKWNIDTYSFNEYENQVVVDSGSDSDAGYMIFEKNGSMALVLTNFNQAIGGTWVNTSDEVILSATGGLALVMKITDDSRKEMTLEYTQIYNDSTKTINKFEISRAK